MKRYRLRASLERRGLPGLEEDEDTDGEWVKYQEAQALVDRLSGLIVPIIRGGYLDDEIEEENPVVLNLRDAVSGLLLNPGKQSEGRHDTH